MTEHDVVIRGETVIDGTGAPRRTADVAVCEGVVTDVGRVAGRGRREIDADGAVVAPWSVDIHTHDDGQVHHDLPWGGRRLVQRADGYRHTLVRGVETYVDGAETGELPGRLVRGAQTVVAR
jgi:N-acyl-D-aspartate/D-glutamate deacylase